MKGAIDVTSGAVDAFNFELITTNARDSGSRLIGTLIALADACPPSCRPIMLQLTRLRLPGRKPFSGTLGTAVSFRRDRRGS